MYMWCMWQVTPATRFTRENDLLKERRGEYGS